MTVFTQQCAACIILGLGLVQNIGFRLGKTPHILDEFFFVLPIIIIINVLRHENTIHMPFLAPTLNSADPLFFRLKQS